MPWQATCLAWQPDGANSRTGFLNDIVALLWPNINVAGCKMTKTIVEPMLAAMLPGPLKSLHFEKLDLGPVPIGLSNVDVQKNEDQGIRLDMDVNWDGKCNITLAGNMIPTVVHSQRPVLRPRTTSHELLSTGYRRRQDKRKTFHPPRSSVE